MYKILQRVLCREIYINIEMYLFLLIVNKSLLKNKNNV